MLEQKINDQYQLIVSPPSEMIEFSPKPLDRLVALAGRVSLAGGSNESYSSNDSDIKLNTLLDHYQEMGTVPKLDPWPEVSDDINQDARPLLRSFWSSPKLNKPLFVPDLNLKDRKPVCKIMASESEWVNLPVINFVSAPGVKNWLDGNGSKRSRQIIRSYALQSEPFGAIDLVSAYAQPNGVVFYRLLRDGSHRLSAAQLRGDKAISVKSAITVYRTPNNIIPLAKTDSH